MRLLRKIRLVVYRWRLRRAQAAVHRLEPVVQEIQRQQGFVEIFDPHLGREPQKLGDCYALQQLQNHYGRHAARRIFSDLVTGRIKTVAMDAHSDMAFRE